MKAISVDELKHKMDAKEDFLLLDVREDYEYNEANLGGKLVPLGTLLENMSEIEDHKDKEIVVMCRSGKRSGMAQQVLEGQGFTDVSNLTGGILAWQEKY